MTQDPELTKMQQAFVRDLMDDPTPHASSPSDPWPEPPATPVPVDLNAELTAFADLMKLLAATDDGDEGTAITALHEDEFAQETFQPDPSDLNPEETST
ncbi:MAG: hypothetical protein KDJ17_07335 [Hyphomicrobiaceae bacterium]|nr:hypothetical protein [Hyphomicrobiaceae bacterium]